MHRKQDVEKVLRTFPIEDIWGIGRRYSKRFKGYFGMDTAWDFYTRGRVMGEQRDGHRRSEDLERAARYALVSNSKIRSRRRNRL